MLILSGSTPLYVLLLRGSGTPRYRPSSGCPSAGSSSTTISTLLIAARRSAGRELSASSIASSNGSLRPGPERASISAMVPESVLGLRGPSSMSSPPPRDGQIRLICVADPRQGWDPLLSQLFGLVAAHVPGGGGPQS